MNNRVANSTPPALPGIVCIVALLAISSACTGQVAPEVEVYDTPDDWGTSLTVKWQAPPYEVTGYEIWRHGTEKGLAAETLVFPDTVLASDFLREKAWELVAEPETGDTIFVYADLSHREQYQYVLVALSAARRPSRRRTTGQVFRAG